MSKGFVLTTQRPIGYKALSSVIEQCIDEKGYLFLRWPHKVRMLYLSEAKTFECQQGQAFDRQRELRWQKKGDQYSVLLLSETQPPDRELAIENSSFCPVGDQWLTAAVEAKTHSPTETRFPKGLDLTQTPDLEQRYFIDEQTACVQFIALKVK